MAGCIAACSIDVQLMWTASASAQAHSHPFPRASVITARERGPERWAMGAMGAVGDEPGAMSEEPSAMGQLRRPSHQMVP